MSFSSPGNKKKIQVNWNKCIRFCLKLKLRQHRGVNEFKDVNRLPAIERLCVATKVFIYWKGSLSFYVNELFFPTRNTSKTISHMASEIHMRKTNLGQKSILVFEPSGWNNLSNNLKILNTTTSFSHLVYRIWMEYNFNHNFYYYCYY